MIGNLTLDQLRVLVAIADTGSFSAAGRQLRRAQSAISQSVATLESVHGVLLFDRAGHRPRLTDVGRVLVDHARQVLATAARFTAVAATSRSGVEPELSLAIDPLVPSAPLTDSLRALADRFPELTVNVSTEGLGGSLRRLRRRGAALAVCLLLPAVPDDVVAFPVLRVRLQAVVSSGHPLARLHRPAERADLAPHVQLILSDPVDTDGPDYGVTVSRPWRFVDLQRRLDFLLAGLGWCRMPWHLVEAPLADGRLVAFDVAHDTTPAEGLVIHAAHLRDHEPGVAARWLLDDLRQRLVGRLT